MSSTTIRHSGVLENTHSPTHHAPAHALTAHTLTEPEALRDHSWQSDRRPAWRYPYGFDPADKPHDEPAHLRHRPGDTWVIGGRPYDPEDPGPYGSPGWRPDRRTGRHRRSELPDPLPEEGRHGDSAFELAASRVSIDHVGTDHFGTGDIDTRPVTTDPATTDNTVPNLYAVDIEGEGPHRFQPMRERAYTNFIRESEELYRAHFEDAETSRAVARLRWLYQVLIALLYLGALPFPEPPAPRRPDQTADENQEQRRVQSRGQRSAHRHGRPSPGPRMRYVRFEDAGGSRFGRRSLDGMIGGGAG